MTNISLYIALIFFATLVAAAIFNKVSEKLEFGFRISYIYAAICAALVSGFSTLSLFTSKVENLNSAPTEYLAPKQVIPEKRVDSKPIESQEAEAEEKNKAENRAAKEAFLEL